MGEPLRVQDTKSLKSKYTQLVQKREFRTLIKQKQAFMVPVVIFFLTFYFLLPVLAVNSNILNKTAFGEISWAWVYALAQFIVVWVSGVAYIKKASGYDEQADQIISKYKKELRS